MPPFSCCSIRRLQQPPALPETLLAQVVDVEAEQRAPPPPAIGLAPSALKLSSLGRAEQSCSEEP